MSLVFVYSVDVRFELRPVGAFDGFMVCAPCL